MQYVLENFDRLVLKDVAEAGGYGVVFGRSMSKEQKDAFIALLQREPRRFIAQEIIDFQDLDILEEGSVIPRKADLRAFVLMAEEPVVWKSGLTRFSRNPDSFIVNSSQGGGFKDTWGIISVEQADRLYWLGRYTERVYTTLRIFYRSFDTMIDEITDSYREFCEMVDIPDIYGDKYVLKSKTGLTGRGGSEGIVHYVHRTVHS